MDSNSVEAHVPWDPPAMKINTSWMLLAVVVVVVGALVVMGVQSDGPEWQWEQELVSGQEEKR